MKEGRTGPREKEERRKKKEDPEPAQKERRKKKEDPGPAQKKDRPVALGGEVHARTCPQVKGVTDVPSLSRVQEKKRTEEQAEEGHYKRDVDDPIYHEWRLAERRLGGRIEQVTYVFGMRVVTSKIG